MLRAPAFLTACPLMNYEPIKLISVSETSLAGMFGIEEFSLQFQYSRFSDTYRFGCQFWQRPLLLRSAEVAGSDRLSA